MHRRLAEGVRQSGVQVCFNVFETIREDARLPPINPFHNHQSEWTVAGGLPLQTYDTVHAIVNTYLDSLGRPPVSFSPAFKILESPSRAHLDRQARRTTRANGAEPSEEEIEITDFGFNDEPEVIDVENGEETIPDFDTSNENENGQGDNDHEEGDI